ncbi:queuine tRNA-ribosyltransferase accessory subunit 2 isoform X1 [Hyperolius riggenbachi]|uniref:queuine tRNA-ribosyltransferase accessory subunit 2 isoform X1 n=1 Tax=Hyperolius riggenbachi TaxID=752182 RepID=UPI0035A3B9EF
MPGCLVPQCYSRWKKDCDISLHVFPRTPEMIKKWLCQLYNDSLRVEELARKIQENRRGAYRVCARHFTRECYEQRGSMMFLKKDAVPTLYLDDEMDDHSYTKRRRTGDYEPVEKISPPPMAVESIPETFELPSSSQDMYHMIPSHVYFTMGQSTDSLVDVQAIEEVATSSVEPLADQETFVQSFQSKKKKKRFRTTRTVGTVTEYFPGQVHKNTQFDRRMGTKVKMIQAFRRPPHRSIGIQCNMGNNQGNLGSPQSETSFRHNKKQQGIPQLIIKEIDSSSSDWSPPVSEDEADVVDIVMSDPEPEDSPSPGSLEEDREKAVEGDEFLREMMESEDSYVDPTDLDNSYIYIPENTEPVNHVQENKFIVFESCLDKLLMCCKCQATKTCTGNIVKIKKYRIGSAVSVTAFCSLKHRFHLWNSQPIIGRIPVGNLLISAGVLCSGSNFAKVESLFRLIGINSICRSTHRKNMDSYLFPAIEHHWQEERLQTVQRVQDQPVALAGDSQYNLPGYGAKFCAYSLFEHSTKKIIDFQVEPWEPGVRVMDVEQKTCRVTLDRLLADRVNIRVLCTDRSPAIRKLLKSHYRQIKHLYNIWHMSKSVANKLTNASQKSDCTHLAPWIAPVKKHLWWAASTCAHDPKLLREKWTSLIHHVANHHEWQDASVYKRCNHKPLSGKEQGDREWLKPGSSAHCRLKEVIADSKLLKDLDRLSLFWQSWEFDVFRSTALKYRSKRNNYTIDETVARTQLAALEYNHNIERMKTLFKGASCGADEGTHQVTKYCLQKIYDPASQAFMKPILTDVLNVASGAKIFLWKSRRTEISQNPRSVHCLLSTDQRSRSFV